MRHENRSDKLHSKKLYSILSFVAYCTAAVTSGYSFSGINPRSAGLAESYTVLARGIDAVEWNPANLALDSQPRFSLRVFSIAVDISNNSLSKGQYDLYNGALLSDEDKADILNSIPSGGLELDTDNEVSILGWSAGPIALSINGVGAAHLLVPKDIVDLVLNGNEFERVYDFSKTDGEGWAVMSLGLSGAKCFRGLMFEKLSIGATVKYLRGFAYGSVIKSEGYLQTDTTGIRSSGKVVTRTAQGGNGFALDFGVAGVINKNWAIGLSFINVLGGLRWNKNAREDVNSFLADSITVFGMAQGDTIVTTDKSTHFVGFFTSDYPGFLRMGVGRFFRNLTILFDYTQGFREAPGLSTTARLSSGLEYNPWGWLPLRTGVSLDGGEHLNLALGAGLWMGFFRLDFSVSSRGGIVPTTTKGLAFSLGSELSH